ncbi:cardiolipin synthase [Acuticoccus sp. MNP-M23]|uniref:cardiolipin synthase n=1 Tax=Acuticoccus sp. MNP-M23 TaxID=3072793 RepID=UPI002815F223|nr:cardiolipin synthase [Acuticoccus sp. MNP-M23]WMS42383.1 cardiolipin synthase [Acuticoccus sp. MNP-M23]
MTALVWVMIVIAIHVVGVVAAFRAAQHAHTAQGAVAWGISLIAIPYFALPLYLFIGPPRPGELEVDQADFRADAYASLLTLRMPPEAIAPIEEKWRLLERLSPAPAIYSGPPRLLIDGGEVFDAVFKAIEAAEHEIVVQFYIYRDDGLGRRLHEALCRRSREGVKVLLLYDGIGARNVPEAYWEGLRKAGVDAHEFHLRRRLPKVMRLNYRNHRKLVAVDGKVAIIGGPNVGDEYLGLDPKFGAWRDTAIEITGPAARVAQASFVVDWQWAGGDPAALEHPPVKVSPSFANTPVLLLPTGPADTLPACSLSLMHLIGSARKRLWLTTPYFVPDLDVLSMLKVAALRGVDVRVMIPDRPDHTIVWLAGFTYADEVMRADVKLYRYMEGFMHHKVMLVDDEVAAIGTVNFDNRSLHLNFENTVVVMDKAFTAKVAAMLERDFARCRPHMDSPYAGFHPITRAIAPATRLLAPLL